MRELQDSRGRQIPKVPGVFAWGMLQRALRAAEEGVYCWDIAEGRIHYTEQCLRMMGRPVNELAPNIFTDAADMVHEEDRAFFLNTVQRYLDNPGVAPMRVELRLLRGSHGWKWIRVNGLLERDAQRKPLRLVGVWVDITRRKMSDLHAMEDRDLFRMLINYLPDNIYFKNRESRFMLANESTARKMGVPTPSDLIGCRDTNFFADETTDIARREELEIMRTGVPITNRVHRECWKGGRSSWCRLSKFPWYSTDGSIKGIVGISSDVTELVEAQNRYRRLARRLDERNRVLEKELDLAGQVQQALLPERLPTRVWKGPDGTERRAVFHHVFLRSSGVSGDCFHVFPAGEAGVGVLICDVMGHDVRAALIASMLRGLMEQAGNSADTPALLLSSLNHQLASILNKANISMFATACYLYLDLRLRRITLSGAGHPAPIVVPRCGEAFLPPIPRSPALGLTEQAMYREYVMQPEPGTKVMLYTDGLTEAQNAAGEELGTASILARLRSHPPANIREMLGDVLAVMRDFTLSDAPSDDLCMLGIEYSETAAGSSS